CSARRTGARRAAVRRWRGMASRHGQAPRGLAHSLGHAAGRTGGARDREADRPRGPTGEDGMSVSDEGFATEEIDTSRAHTARVYDYWLGGKNNYEVDAAMAERVAQVWPGVRRAARLN